ncbi:MAG: hypothetical protein JWM43_4243 [Acidobacteriaceae bacterium]|nr:hypothetical protein [Acidobacteriaceae bacterium]
MDERESVRKLQAKAGGLLPGVAAICMFLLFLTMVNVYGALVGGFGTGIGKYGVLTLCTMLAAGIFGLLRLRRWGYSLVMAGCVLLAMGDIYYFSKLHVTFFALRGLFELVFFLYLVRPEVRERLR